MREQVNRESADGLAKSDNLPTSHEEGGDPTRPFFHRYLGHPSSKHEL